MILEREEVKDERYSKGWKRPFESRLKAGWSEGVCGFDKAHSKSAGVRCSMFKVRRGVLETREVAGKISGQLPVMRLEGDLLSVVGDFAYLEGERL